jgi:hypothetical protein
LPLVVYGLPRYGVDDIVKPTACVLLVPYGRSLRKKEVATGIALPAGESIEYSNELIPPNYAIMVVSWVAPGFDEHELDFPTAQGIQFLGRTICSEVLWNKEDIELEMSAPSSQPSVAASSPPDDDGSDDDDDGGDDNDDNGPPRSSPPSRSSPPPSGFDHGTSLQVALGNATPTSSGPNQGTGLQVALGNATPPPSGLDQGTSYQVAPGNTTPPPCGPDQGTSQCPPPPRKTTDVEEPIPPNHTKMS